MQTQGMQRAAAGLAVRCHPTAAAERNEKQANASPTNCPTRAPSESAALWAALAYARLGWPVGPLWAIAPDGTCTCREGASCRHPGKHPDTDLCPRGSLDFTTDERTLRRWFSQKPAAGVGVDLKRAALVDVAPDSSEWLETFSRHGLPTDAPHFRSSFATGHVHILLRRPSGAPTTRICKSGQYDIMSAGIAALPATLDCGASVARAWQVPPPDNPTAIPEAPAWVVEMLSAAVARRTARRGGEGAVVGGALTAASAGVGGAPPVRLSGERLATWRGERLARKGDGTVDRSLSLVRIAEALYAANASREAIVAALRERDHTLGWHKFCERADGDTRYGEIADLVADKAQAKLDVFDDAIATRATAVEAEAAGDIARLEARLRRAEAEGGFWRRKARERAVACWRERMKLRPLQRELEHLRAVHSQAMALLRNVHLSATERIVALMVAFEVGSRVSRSDIPEQAPGTMIKVSIEVLARQSGVSADTVGRTLRKLAALKLIQREQTLTRDDDGLYRSQVFVKLPAPNVPTTLWCFATWTPQAAEERRRHGGVRRQRTVQFTPCPHHPDGPVAVTCAQCHAPLTTPTSAPTAPTLGTATATEVQDAAGDSGGGSGGRMDHAVEAAATEPQLAAQWHQIDYLSAASCTSGDAGDAAVPPRGGLGLPRFCLRCERRTVWRWCRPLATVACTACTPLASAAPAATATATEVQDALLPDPAAMGRSGGGGER